MADPLTNNPVVGSSSGTDYVLSGGQICLDSSFVPVSCGGAHTFGPINHNLGANQAAYAILFPELNNLLSTKFSTLSDTVLADYTFHMDFRLGCDPSFGTASDVICTGADNGFGKNLNNGYEQSFLATYATTVHVPEPGSLALLGIGLAALGARRARRRSA